MSLDAALAGFYERHGFGDTPGARPKCVPVYAGCLLVPLPNIETRNRFLKYHDLRDEVLECRPQRNLHRLRRGMFRFYIVLSLVIHATIAIPAVIARAASDLRRGKTLTETFRPRLRNDLY